MWRSLIVRLNCAWRSVATAVSPGSIPIGQQFDFMEIIPLYHGIGRTEPGQMDCVKGSRRSLQF